jgi:phage-related protein
MAIVGAAYVEIHATVDKVTSEIRDGLSKAIQGEGTKGGKSYADEFGKEATKGLERHTQSAVASMKSAWSSAGSDSGKSFADSFAQATSHIKDQVIKLKVEADSAAIASVETQLRSLSDKTVHLAVTGVTDALSDVVDLNQALERFAASRSTAQVDVDGATEAFHEITDLQRSVNEFGRERATAQVDIDGSAAATAELSTLYAELQRFGSERTTATVDVDTSRATSGLNNLGNSSSMVSGRIAATITSVVALTPSLASLGASAVAAAGALYLIPAALGAIGVGVGAAMAGFSGIGEAFKTLTASDKASAAAAQTNAATRNAAAKSIEAAQNRLSDTVRQANRTQVQSAQQVADARDALAQAERSAADRIASAQDSLSSAVEAAAQSQMQAARAVAQAEAAVEDARVSGAERIADAQASLADAVEAAARSQKASQRAIADAEQSLTDTRIRAAESISDAQDRVTSAIESAARSQAAAADKVTSSQLTLQRAQESARDTQEALTRAYQTAEEQLQQLSFSLKDAALDEEDAVDRLDDAKQKLAAARAGGAGAEEIDDLDRAVRRAEVSLDEVKDRYADLQEESKKAGEAGVEGSDVVVNAQKNAQKATEAVTEAEKGVSDARADAARAAADSAKSIAAANADLAKTQIAATRSISDAERDVADARESASQAAADSAERIADAQKNVAKAQQDAARGVASAEQKLADARAQQSQDAVDAAKSVEKAQANLNKAQADGARDVAKAQEDLARAISSANQQNEDAARAVTEAQQALADASVSASEKSSAASIAAAAAMAKLSPAAQDLVSKIRALGPAWSSMQLDVQERMLRGVGDAVNLLGQNYIPILGTALGTVADGYNKAMLAALGFLNTTEGQALMKTGLDNSAAATSILAQALVPVVKGFTELFAVGSQYMPAFAQSILDAANGWATYIQNASASGELNRIIEAGIAVFQTLWQVIQNVAGILGTVFSAGVASGNNFLGTLALVTGEVNKFLATGEGNAALVAIFTTIGDVVQGLLPGIFALAGALATGIIAIGPQLGPLAEAFSNIAISVAPLLTDLMTLAAVVLPPLVALLNQIAPVAGPIVAAFIGMKVVYEIAQGFKALQAAVLLLNVAFAANPIGIIVIALAGLVAGLVYAYTHFEGFRNVVDGVFSWISGAVTGVINFFKTTFVDGIGNGISAVIDFFRNLPEQAGAFLSDLPNKIAYALGSLAGTLVRLAIDGWQGFQSGITTAFNATVVWFTALPGRIGDFFTALPGVLLNAGTWALNALLSGFTTGFVAVVGWLTGLPGQIGAFFTALPGNFLQFGTDILTGLVNGLVAGGTAVWDFFAGLIDSFVQGFKDALGIASPSTVFADFGKWILEGLINGLKGMIQAVIGIVLGVGQAIVDGFNSFISAVTGLWDTFWTGLNSITGGKLDGIRVFIENIIAVIQLIFQTFIALITGDWEGFWNGISTLATTFLSGLENLWGSAWAAIQNVATTIWNAIDAYFTNAFAVWKRAFDIIWGAVETAWTTIWTAIQTAGTTIWNAISQFFTTALNAYKQMWDTIWNAVSTLFSTVWNAIRDFAQSVWNALYSFYQSGFSNWSALWASLWKAVQDLFSTVWNAIRTAGETIWNAISQFFTTALNAFKTAWDTIWNAVSKAWETSWNAIRTAGATIWAAIQAFFTAGLNDFKTRWDSFWGAISTAFDKLWQGIKSVAQTAWEGIQSMFKGGINLVIDAVNWPIDKINGALGISIPTIPRLASGGDVHAGEGRVGGLPGRTADRTPALLSAEEHVWSGKEVMGVGGHEGVRKLRKMAREGLLDGFAEGGHVDDRNIPAFQPGAFIVNDKIASVAGNFLDALNRGQPEAVQATGGRYATGPTRHFLGGNVELPGFAAGGALVAAQQFAQAQNGKPYIWGGVGPAGYDCSGFQSAITNVLRGKNPYSRLGNTDSMPWSGFTSGLTSSYTVGRKLGNPGHTAGTLGGVNVEAGGSPSKTKYGAGAAGSSAAQFPDKFSLPEIGGAFVDGGGGGLFDPAAAFDAAASALGLPENSRNFTRDIMPNSPGWLEPMGVSFHDKGWDGMRAAAIKLLTMVSTLGGLLGGGDGTIESGPIQEQVRAVAAQFGWGEGAEWDALSAIIQKESSWNPNAANSSSSARGLFQKMTSLHGALEPTVAGQAQWGLNYIKSRYGDPIAALQHHNQVGSYDTGGWLSPGITQAINGTGKPEAIIADPMTTFERSFKNVFKWFAPECRDAIENSWRGASDWIRDLIERLSPREKPSTETPATPPVIVPPIQIPEIPKVEVPPVVVPQVPTGQIGMSFQDALSQFAPDLSMAIAANSAPQIAEFSRAIQGNDQRMSAISTAMGVPLGDLNGMLDTLARSVAPITQNPPNTGSVQSTNPLAGQLDSALNKLFTEGVNIDRANNRYGVDPDRVLRDEAWRNGQSTGQYRAENPYVNTHTDPIREMELEISARLAKIPSLAAKLSQAFPDIAKSLQSSAPDIREVMSSRANDLLAFLNAQSSADANALLNALGASPTTPAAATVMQEAQKVAGVSQQVQPSNSLNVSEGAVQLVINGNPDAATIEQINEVLQDTLTEWSDTINREYEARS